MGVKIIRLERVRPHDPASGGPFRSYVFQANLSQDGELQIDGYAAVSRLCKVIEQGPDCGRHEGFLVLTSDGWVLSCDSGRSRLGATVLNPGNYVNVSKDDGGSDLFRVASVEDAQVEIVRF